MEQRQIKFRAFHPDKKEMIYNGVIVTDGRAYLSHREFEDGIQTNNAMQFTGLLDKNGKEVWEGDIVESLVLLSENGENLRTVVKWGEKGRLANGALSNNPQWMNNHQPEVIGNIYENPELLSSPKDS